MGHTKFTREKAYKKQLAIKFNWLLENGPCKICGSRINLEVDHIDRSKKKDHKVWTWSPQKREEELAKCQVLCYTCHKEKTSRENSKPKICGTVRSYWAGCKCSECMKANCVYVIQKHIERGYRHKKDKPISIETI